MAPAGWAGPDGMADGCRRGPARSVWSHRRHDPARCGDRRQWRASHVLGGVPAALGWSMTRTIGLRGCGKWALAVGSALLVVGCTRSEPPPAQQALAEKIADQPMT